jgi:hypothetical protein
VHCFLRPDILSVYLRYFILLGCPLVGPSYLDFNTFVVHIKIFYPYRLVKRSLREIII